MSKEITPLSIILIKELCVRVQLCNSQFDTEYNWCVIELNPSAYFQMLSDIYLMGITPDYLDDSFKIRFEGVTLTFVKQTQNATFSNS